MENIDLESRTEELLRSIKAAMWIGALSLVPGSTTYFFHLDRKNKLSISRSEMYFISITHDLVKLGLEGYLAYYFLKH